MTDFTKRLKKKIYFGAFILRGFYLKFLIYFACFRLIVGKNVQIIGFNSFRHGRKCAIGDYTVITINNRSSKEKSFIFRSGIIGKHNFWSTNRRVFVGNFFYSSSFCKVLSASHDYSDPTMPYMCSPVIGNSNIWIQDNVFLGAGVSIIGGVTIGFGSFIQAGASLTGYIPPLSYVTGNGVVEKRFNWRDKCWVDAASFDPATLPTYGEFKKQLVSFGFEINPFAVSNSWGSI